MGLQLIHSFIKYQKQDKFEVEVVPLAQFRRSTGKMEQLLQNVRRFLHEMGNVLIPVPPEKFHLVKEASSLARQVRGADENKIVSL